MKNKLNLTNLRIKNSNEQYLIYLQDILLGTIDKNKEGISLLNSLKKIINYYMNTEIIDNVIFEDNFFLEKIVNEANAIIAVIQPDGTMSMINTYGEKISGYTKEEIKSKPFFWSKFLKKESQKEVFKILEDAKHGEIKKHYINTWISKLGEERIFDWSNSLILKEDGSLDYIFTIGINITERKKLEEEVLFQKEQFEIIFNTAKDGIAILDLDSHFIDCNDAYLEMTGYSKKELIGKSCIEMSIPEDRERAASAMKKVLKDGFLKNFEKSCVKKDGSSLFINMTISRLPNQKNLLINTKDITLMKKHQIELEHAANYDVLTNLPNRLLLSKQLTEKMSCPKEEISKIALLYLDLDGFKKINDIFGHDFGDELLIILSKKMSITLRDNDLLARLGGDEFIIILSNIQNEKDILNIINRLLHIVSSPLLVKNNLVNISVSIGVTLFPQKIDVEADMLLRQADQAMYEAKLRGKNQYVFYNEISDTDYIPGENAFSLKNGLKNNEFVLHFQPKINVQTGEFVGVESLIRWNDPTKETLVFPDNFLPIIDNRPLMYEVDKWVFKESIKTLDNWQKENIKSTISINLSAYSFKQNDLINFIEDTLKEFPTVSPKNIEIEILETNSLHELSEVLLIIENLHEKGFSVALDDFGTGYSTLSYLKKLNVDTLKIDKSFVIDLLSDKNDYSIVLAAIGLANSFNAKSVAEGVESIEHLSILKIMGCDFAQGYAISRPLPEEKFKVWLSLWDPYKCK